MRSLLLFAAACSAAMFSYARPLMAEDDLVGHVAEGKKTFETVCGRCHGIDKPQALDMERPEWAGIVEKMEKRGAKMTDGERELILDYLGIRNVFLTKCTVCHTKERILDRQQAFEQWKGTVEKMAAKKPALMTEGEVRSIIAYLTVILGVPPESR